MEVTRKRGGPATRPDDRRKLTHPGRGGRPPLTGERMVKANVSLPAEIANHLKALGNGNLSAGIRITATMAVQGDGEGPSDKRTKAQSSIDAIRLFLLQHGESNIVQIAEGTGRSKGYVYGILAGNPGSFTRSRRKQPALWKLNAQMQPAADAGKGEG